MGESSTAVFARQKLSRFEIISYGLPRSGSAMMFLMVSVYLSKFYTDTLLLAPAFVAWTFLIGRFWDGFTDPIMGYASDATKSRMGRRRPYFLLSAIPVGIAYFYLWSPPDTLKDWGLFLYLTATYLLTYTLWTVFSIPHNSLGAELTMDYHERTVLTGVREGLGVIGALVGTMAPPIFAARLGDVGRGYSYLAGMIGLVTAVSILICFFSVKENPEFQKQHPIAIREGLKALYRNRPFRILVIAFVIALIGNAFVPILTLYMADYVVQMPRIAPVIILSYVLAAAVSIVFWTRLSRRIGKKEAWSRALILASVVFALSTYYHQGTWLVWIILAILAGFAYGSTVALPPSMMADVIDLDQLQTGRRREGAYFGIWSFIDKAAVGIAVFIGMYSLDLMGYAPNQPQPLHVFWTLKVLYSILPAICFAACFYLLRHYPITQQEHERIRAEIDAKKAASAK
ncbi:MAG: MFS transporter [Candidatus Hydrogenedentota bacterium]|nr:MAG: MFS transporter [Candidatus Hydrogenedentota bacterium]